MSAVMLSWFVDAETAECSIKSATPLSSDKVMGRTGTSAATGDNVSLLCLRKYLSADAWGMVQSVVNEVNSESVWYCVTCTGIYLWHVPDACSGHSLSVTA